jgi:hypothetical protein
MAFEDDQLKKTVFPTRDGTPQGAGAERKMLEPIGGAATIRTQIKDNPDGSTTMLRTRAGNPEFTTRGGIQDSVCIKGPLTELDYRTRVWWPKAVTPAEKLKYDIRTTDGIFTRHLRPLKTMLVFAGPPEGQGPQGSRKPYELWFSRDNGVTPAVAPATPAERKKAIWEHGARTFHPAVPAQETGTFKLGINYAIERIKTLKLTFPTKQKITYTFSKLFNAITAPTVHTCTNQNAEEKTMKQRTYIADNILNGVEDFLERVKLTVGSRKLVQIECASKGWFLDVFGGPNLAQQTYDDSSFRFGLKEIANPAGKPEAVNLARVAMWGAMWHGLAYSTYLEAMAYNGIQFVQINTIPDDYNPADDGSVYYVKSPANLPAPVMGINFQTIGAAFLNEAFFFGTTKRYSVTGSFGLGSSGFIHFDQNNEPSWMKLEAPPADYLWTSGPGPGQWTVSFRVVLYDGGTPKISGIPPTWVQLADFNFSHVFDEETYNLIDWTSFAFSRVCAAPDGRKATIEIRQVQSISDPSQQELTRHAVEVTVPDNKIGIVAALVWNISEAVSDIRTYASRSGGITRTQWVTGANTSYRDFEDMRIESEVYTTWTTKLLAFAAYSAAGLLILVEETNTRTSNGTLDCDTIYDPASHYGISTPVDPFAFRLMRLAVDQPTSSTPPPLSAQTSPGTSITVQYQTFVQPITGASHTDINTWSPVDFSDPAYYFQTWGPDNTSFSCGTFSSTVATGITDSFTDPTDSAHFANTLKHAIFKAYTVRKGNSTAGVFLRNPAVTPVPPYSAQDLEVPVVAVVCPASTQGITGAPADIYATYNPKTLALSVGTTPRCFV